MISGFGGDACLERPSTKESADSGYYPDYYIMLIDYRVSQKVS